MFVRCLHGQLSMHLRPPTNAEWYRDLPANIDFAALVPLQVSALRQEHGDTEAAMILGSFKNLLLGGGPLDPDLEAYLSRVQPTDARWLHTYGMTETITHIAWRPLGEEVYTCLPGTETSVTNDGLLCIHAPHLGQEALTTTDLAEVLSPQRFRIIGRANTIIHSGGIKIQPEQIEAAFAQLAPHCPAAVVGLSHAQLGEQAALLHEGDLPQAWPVIREQLKALLPKHHAPQTHIRCEHLPRSAAGKILRRQAQALAAHLTAQGEQ